MESELLRSPAFSHDSMLYAETNLIVVTAIAGLSFCWYVMASVEVMGPLPHLFRKQVQPSKAQKKRPGGLM